MSAYENLVKAGIGKVDEAGRETQKAKSFLAGVYISLGCMMMLLVKSDQSLSPAVSNILSGVCFSIGLFAVMTCNGELFTGDCLMVFGVREGEYFSLEMLVTLLHVFLYNFIGVAFMFLVFISTGMNGVMEYGIEVVANAKESMSLLQLFVRSIMCNFLVCMSVWIGASGKTVTEKFIAALIPVTAFVALGFEHSIANLFMYLVMNPEPQWLINSLISCVVGNLIGGVFLYGGLQIVAGGKPRIDRKENW